MTGSKVAKNLSLPPLTIVIGGAASGKSMLAERLVTETGLPRVYLATAQAWDDEMQSRITVHRDRRDGWTTVEAPRDLAGALGRVPAGSVVLLDCATMWLTNVMLADDGDLAAEEAALMAAFATCAAPVVVVTNEVGLSIVPENALARAFRDAQGRLNQRLAERAGLVVAVWAGLPLVLKGASPW